MEEVKELELEEDKEIRSKYRSLIDKFLASDMQMAKIKSVYPSAAHAIARGLRQWIKEEERLKIWQDGRITYLMKVE
ncbi:unnamed protein product [marine sediment metagenome]|uniref:Uncharacterized protein n=1 Tax=marine sediment metagenome TaxID=412755 RepID=X0VLM1_9ZZZZ